MWIARASRAWLLAACLYIDVVQAHNREALLSRMEHYDMSEELLVSADSHVIEDPQLWKKRLPQSFQDRAPVFPELKVGGAFQAQAGGHDPKARLSEMVQDGVSGEVLYPSFALDLYGLSD